MEKDFLDYLRLSDAIRNGYRNSLLPINWGWSFILEEIMEQSIPNLFEIVYSNVGGTKYNVEEQKYMDFIPGFLLIHIDEWIFHYRKLAQITNNIYFPILCNYSSDYIAMNGLTGEICEIFHDEESIGVLFKDSNHFFKTLVANYKNNVYFLDDDGYLDYDEDKEYEVASQLNPDVAYWKI